MRRPLQGIGSASWLLIALGVVALPLPLSAGCGGISPTPAALDDLEAVYASATPWASFVGDVRSRQALWERNWTEGRVDEELLARARATGGPWRILAISEPGCSDSVNTVPYLARLAESLPGVELRVVSAAVGRPWMEAHRSPDGRAATPTVLLLDETFQLRGCWVEQPARLQELWLPVVAAGTTSREIGRKMDWYAEDAGGETLREFVEVMEAALGEAPICPGVEGPRIPSR